MKEQKKNLKPASCYRAYCPIHDWEGAAQQNKVDAEADLRAHKEYYPDEDHTGSEVKEC